MYLVRLLYVSKVQGDVGPHDLKQIVESSIENNSKVDVTGALLFDSSYFLQCLEGSRKEVNKLYMKILRDARHTDVILLYYQQTVQRDFSHWSMGYIPNTALNKEVLMKYSGKSIFNPMEMSGDSAHNMLVELAQKLPDLYFK